MPRHTVRVLVLLAALAATGCASDGGDASSDGKAGTPSPGPTADVGHLHVRGGGALADDWDDEGLLGENLPVRSDLAALWQTVLWADGYLDKSRIDCHYSRATRRATRAWQSNHALPADGIVGQQSFGKAARRLVRRDGLVVFEGKRHDVPLRRAEDGRYLVEDAGRYKPLRRDTTTLTVCARAAR
ncbi:MULTISPECIES: peptidoglycan-binding domain-containing protein [Streptomyces]|uniref:Peptidoglycan binding-like domain-containing protein n=1 Tax=Streptomyces cacaoi TaxID=1898 RepID=A0A4Y3QWN8_STRCI|nr:MULTISPECIES: peptidoglycan-binding protein [Streptomyces]NNG87174.1 peptidoglycan-binding protein [Streptomyces cacaoi]GEB49785.1 hypothetical protein SCA03_23360 [Streptomyces cacaoi]